MNAAEVSRFLDGVKSFRLDQLSQYLTGRLIAPSSATWRVDVVHKYRHPLALRRAERVAHSLHHEAFHSSLKHEQKRHKMFSITIRTRPECTSTVSQQRRKVALKIDDLKMTDNENTETGI